MLTHPLFHSLPYLSEDGLYSLPHLSDDDLHEPLDGVLAHVVLIAVQAPA